MPYSEVEYATPVPVRRGTFAATMILFGGLSLIVLGGCFLIGILITIQHVGLNGAVQQMPMTAGEIVFVVVLSALALASFGGAIALLILGTRALLQVTRI
jgi:hypothetical protein